MRSLIFLLLSKVFSIKILVSSGKVNKPRAIGGYRVSFLIARQIFPQHIVPANLTFKQT